MNWCKCMYQCDIGDVCLRTELPISRWYDATKNGSVSSLIEYLLTAESRISQPDTILTAALGWKCKQRFVYIVISAVRLNIELRSHSVLYSYNIKHDQGPMKAHTGINEAQSSLEFSSRGLSWPPLSAHSCAWLIHNTPAVRTDREWGTGGTEHMDSSKTD